MPVRDRLSTKVAHSYGSTARVVRFLSLVQSSALLTSVDPLVECLYLWTGHTPSGAPVRVSWSATGAGKRVVLTRCRPVGPKGNSIRKMQSTMQFDIHYAVNVLAHRTLQQKENERIPKEKATKQKQNKEERKREKMKKWRKEESWKNQKQD